MQRGMGVSRRQFLKGGASSLAATIAAAALSSLGVDPREALAQERKKPKIKWRMQTYAGTALGQHVIKPSIDAFNLAANGEMVIELYYADQLVPQGELIKALQRGILSKRTEMMLHNRSWSLPHVGVPAKIRFRILAG